MLLACCLLAIGSSRSQVPMMPVGSTKPAKGVITVDSMKLSASLLTITPGQDSYSLYGHTAVRIRDERGLIDYVFNYGAFSMEDDNFLWKFALGETDYTLAVERMMDVVMWYSMEERMIIEQKLNMTPGEVRYLFENMRENATTPGWTYRYTFLDDNCATRPVALLRESLSGELVWKKEFEPTTYRKLINSHLLPRHAWSSLGQDMLMGAGIDTIISQEAHTGFPMELFSMIASAEVVGADGSRRKLVLTTDTINASEPPAETEAAEEVSISDSLTSPTVVAILFLLLTTFVSMRRFQGKDKAVRIYDALVITGITIVGLLLWFEFLFSSLPAVDSNALTLLFHPLALVWLPLRYVNRSWGSRSAFFARLQPMMIALFVVAWSIVGQFVPVPVLIVALSLLIRSTAEIFYRRKQ